MVRKILSLGITGLMSVVILSASCQNPSTKNDGPPAIPTAGIAVITAASDFSAANFEAISSADYSVTKNLHPGLHTDLFVRAFGGDIYILERFGRDNVIKYTARNPATPAYQQNLGSGLNIQDIVVVSEVKAYISSQSAGSHLIVFNPKTGNPASTIDLSEFAAGAGTADAEAHPSAGALARHNGYVYVACQRLNASYEPAEAGLIAIIDILTNEAAGSILLNRKNPWAMSVWGDRMLVASAGDFFDPESGGIELINLSSNSNMGVIADGNFSNVVFVSADRAYTTTASWSASEIAALDLSTGLGATVDGIGDASGGMAFDGVKLYVGDRGFGQAGVVAINPETSAAERKIETEMPPAGLATFSAN